jgi:hypothetical protein
VRRSEDKTLTSFPPDEIPKIITQRLTADVAQANAAAVIVSDMILSHSANSAY